MKRVLMIALSAGLLTGCSSLGKSDAAVPPPSESVVASQAIPAARPRVLGTSGMKSLQLALAAKGYYSGKIDGLNGPRTRYAVARFQQNMGIVPITGRVDEQTWSALGLSEGSNKPVPRAPGPLPPLPPAQRN